MPSPDPNLSNFFSDLKKFENNGEYDKALKICNKILEADPENEKAIHCKLVCFIHSNEFLDALKLLNDVQNDDLRSRLDLEHAYCQYRLNDVEESLKRLQRTDHEDDVGVKELKAQALYRIENFEECYQTYVDLIKNSNDDYEDERFVNLVAVVVGMKSLNAQFKYDLSSLVDNTYEIIYNKACTLIATKNYNEAIKKLTEAENSCRKFLVEDGATEEEIESELAIIHAQTAYCMQQQGKDDAALKIYNQILKQRLSDLALIAVVSNNIVAIHRDQNLFDSKKKIKSALSENAESKLSSNQKLNIHFNHCLFLINTNQFDACRKELPAFRTKFPQHGSDSILIESYMLVKEKDLPGAIKVLKTFVQNNTGSAVRIEVALLLVQLLLQQEDHIGAQEVLENLPGELRFRPAIVCLLLKLYEKFKNSEASEKLISQCIEWYEKHGKAGNKKSLVSLYNEAARFYINQNRPQEAVKYLEKIIKMKGKNPKIVSMLIHAYSMFDPSKAQSFQKELPSIEEILNSVDIENLENRNWSLGIKYVKKSTKDTPKAGVSEKKKKTKRKKILPKNYDPNVPPDPERWLPKYERSNYRKKKDKKAVGKGTQGAVGDLPEIKPSPKPATLASPPGPRQQRPTQKKKKKVGRK